MPFLVLILLIMMIVCLVRISRIERTMKDYGEGQNRLSMGFEILKGKIEKFSDFIRTSLDDIKKKLPETTDLSKQEPEIEKEEVISRPPLPPIDTIKVTPEPSVPTPKPEIPSETEVSVQDEVRERSRFVESANDIIQKIWSWILVGEEYRPKGVTMEYAIASTWLLRLGIVAIVTCVGYFLKWSIEQGLINDAGRVAISIIAGIGMLVSGQRILKGKYHLLGVGLMGGGLATLYFSVYAAVGLYRLIPVLTGFMLIIFVTVTAGLLAIRTDSLLLAILGIIGGYYCPLMIRTAEPNFIVFYSYMLFLSLGTLGVAHYKPWRLLNYLSFLFTYFLFFISLTQYHRSDFAVTLTFLSLFFVIQSSLVYLYNISRGNKSTILEIIHLLLNAGFYSATAYFLILGAYGKPYPAIMSISLAVFYILHMIIFLKRKIVDRNLLISFIALAGFYTTWTMPLIMEKETLTLSWALQAFIFFWLGYKLNSNFIQHVAYIIYGLVFYRLLFLDVPGNFGPHPVDRVQMSVYWQGMIERLWNFGISIGSIMGAFFLQKKKVKPEKGLEISEQNDMTRLVDKGIVNNVLYWFCALFLFLFVHLELNTMFAYFQPLRLPVLTILWCAMAVYFLCMFLQTKGHSNTMLVAMSAFLLVAIFKIFIIDLYSWKFSWRLLYETEYTLFYTAMRLVDFGSVLIILFAIWWFLSHTYTRQRAASSFGLLGLVLLFIYMSLELNTFLYWCLPEFRAGGISILWALFAIGFIVGGIWKSIPCLRYSGLSLFAVVVGKVFLIDLGYLSVIYRVVAFLVVGVFLLSGAFSYMYASGKFAHKSK